MGILIRNDARLVGQTLRGNREAFSRLVERHLSTAYAVALASLRNPTDAEDAAQEAFLKAYTKLDTLREPAKFLPWLLSIVRRESVAILRVKKRDAAIESRPPQDEHVEPSITARDRARVLREAMEGLDETSRAVLTLHYFAGKSTREIAVALNLSTSAVKKRLERGRYSLGKQLAEVATASDSDSRLKDVRAELLSVVAILVPTWGAEATVAVTAGGVVSLGAWVSGGVAIAALAVSIAALQYGDPSVIMASPVPVGVSTESAESTIVVASADDGSDDASSVKRIGEDTNRSTRSAPRLGERTTSLAENHGPRAEPDQDVPVRQVSMNFVSSHIAEMVAHASKEVKKPIVIDWRVVPIPFEWSDWFPSNFGTRIPEKYGEEDQPWDWYPEEMLSYVTDGKCEYINLRNLPVSYCLSTLLGPMGLSYVVDDEFVWVSSPEHIAIDYALRRPDPEKVAQVEMILASEVSLAFEDSHLSEILEFVCDYVDLNFVVDHRVVGPKERLAGRPFKQEEKESRRTRSVAEAAIPYLNMRNVSLESALFATLTQLDLAYEERKHYIFVSTTEQLAADRERWGRSPSYGVNVSPEFDSFLLSSLGDVLKDDEGQDYLEPTNRRKPSRVADALDIIKWPGGAIPEMLGSATSRYAGYLPPCPREMPLHAYLDILTRPMGLRWDVSDSWVDIVMADTVVHRNP